MKKWMIPVVAALCCVSVTACGDNSSASTEPTAVTTTASDKAQTTEAPSETTAVATDAQATTTTTAADTQSGELTEDGIRTLMKGNVDCVMNIFFTNDLPTQGDPIRDHVSQVDTTKFASYADFEAYVGSIYTKETTKMLLNDYPYEGQPKYLNIDGKLCLDTNLSGAKGYYVDWSSYTVNITKSDDKTCEFTLTAKITEPGDNPTPEDYPATGKAVFEDGKWLLESRIL